MPDSWGCLTFTTEFVFFFKYDTSFFIVHPIVFNIDSMGTEMIRFVSDYYAMFVFVNQLQKKSLTLNEYLMMGMIIMIMMCFD